MRTIPRRPARIALINLAFAIALFSASVSHAEGASECGPWTLFPDFRCDDHQARPDGSFIPMGMPYLFEDPYITSNLQFAYLYHRFPDGSAPGTGPVFDGGGAHVLALQIRLAITERIAFIATKDGLTILRPGDASAVQEHTGIMDMSIGFKGSLYESKDRDFILTPAIRYEIPMGSNRLFQGFGDGVWIPSASFRWGLQKLGLEGANIVGSLGGQVPVDSDDNVRSLFYNLHLDYGIKLNNSVVKYVVPFVEFNGMRYTRSGKGRNPIHLRGGGTVPLSAAQALLRTGSFDGVDIANLGSRGMDGENFLVMGGGFRIPTTWGVSFGVMYEGPLTNRRDIQRQRFTFMATWEL